MQSRPFLMPAGKAPKNTEKIKKNTEKHVKTRCFLTHFSKSKPAERIKNRRVNISRGGLISPDLSEISIKQNWTNKHVKTQCPTRC
jgi:hypothetical protein